MNSRKLSLPEIVQRWREIASRKSPVDAHDWALACYAAADELESALAQQETDVTKIAGWCALCEEPNGCPHGHSEEEWIEANHRMIEKRRAALAQQAQPEPYFAGSPCGVQFKFEPDKQLITRVGVCRHEATETRI